MPPPTPAERVTAPRGPSRPGPAAALLLATLVGAGTAAATSAQEAGSGASGRGGQDADRAPAVDVTITGLSGERLRSVRSQLGILRLQRSEGALEHRVERAHGRAVREIRRALEPFGLYRARVEASLERTGPSAWRAAYRVDAGEPVTIGEVDVRVTGEGRDDPRIARILRRSEVREGRPLHHPAWERLKGRLRATAVARGYLVARIEESRVDVDLERYRADVHLWLATGPRYRFGEVRFAQTPRFSEAFYRSFVTIEPGTPYTLDALRAFRSLMAGSGYFRGVEVEAPPDSARGLEVPVLVRVEVRPRSALSLGAGFSTDQGPRAGGDWSLRYLGRSGHRLGSEAWAGLRVQRALVRYALPIGVPGHEELSAAAGLRREDFEGVTSRSLHAMVGATHRRGGWRESAQLRLERDWFSVGGVETRATMVLPRLAWSRDARDDPLVPTRAGRLSVEVQGTSTAFGSNVGFVQLAVDGKLIRSPYEGGRVLVRAEVGLTAVDELAALPTTLRFYAGGDESVRGYAYRSLGPTTPAGQATGGRHRAVGSLEWDQRVTGPFSAALFVDVGTAAARLSGLDAPAVGTGAGVRWRSPIGPVRLDVAFPLDDPATDVRLHFLAGPDL